ncbi:unnamed protein product [Musa banksii]
MSDTRFHEQQNSSHLPGGSRMNYHLGLNVTLVWWDACFWE